MGTIKVTTRRRAIKDGLPFYQTGKPCKRGHRAPRTTMSGTCTECTEFHEAERLADYLEKTRELCLLNGARKRAKDGNMDFDLTEFDIHIPKRCPVFGTPFKEKSGRWIRGRQAPSIDRLDNTKGYTMHNVNVISRRANTLKSDATADELEAVARWMRRKGM